MRALPTEIEGIALAS